MWREIWYRAHKIVKIALPTCVAMVTIIYISLYARGTNPVTMAPFLQRHYFKAQKLALRNGTLKLLGYYDAEKECGNKHRPADVLLEIENVSNLITEMLKTQRLRGMRMKMPYKMPVSAYNFSTSTLYKMVDKSKYNSKNYDGDMVYPDLKYFVKDKNVKNISCFKLFQNDTYEIHKAKKLMEFPLASKLPSEYIKETKNCSTYVKEAGYITSSLTGEEEKFPLAFSIIMFKDVDQFEVLLRAIYRPQNYYCIHVDNKSDDQIYDAISGIARCFDNVVLSSGRYNVTWGKYSILEPEFDCMELLTTKFKKWKYFINLTGQEFPIRTNSELVAILKSFNGSNNVEGTVAR